MSSFSLQTGTEVPVLEEIYNPWTGATAVYGGERFESNTSLFTIDPVTGQPVSGPQAPNPMAQGTQAQGAEILGNSMGSSQSPNRSMNRRGRWGIPLWALLILIVLAVVGLVYLVFGRRRRRGEQAS